MEEAERFYIKAGLARQVIPVATFLIALLMLVAAVEVDHKHLLMLLG